MNRPDAPDPTAWGLHGAIHRNVPHARCVMHVHSIHATVLASLADSTLPPIDQNSAMFFNRHVVDGHYGGLAFEEEGERCSQLLSDPKVKVMVMGNHGILVIGDTVADAFNRMFYFERAAETYIKALWTGRPLRTLSDEIAEKAAQRDGRLSRPGRAAPRRAEGDPRRAGAGLPELTPGALKPGPSRLRTSLGAVRHQRAGRPGHRPLRPEDRLHARRQARPARR